MEKVYDLGKLIYEYRKNNQLTQGKLAVMLGYSHSLISKLESGKYQPTEQLKDQILQLLNIKKIIHQENHPLSAQLSSWQISIQQRNYQASNQIYQELKKFPISYFYNLRSMFYLQSFKHNLLFLNIQEASNLLEPLKKEVKRLSTTASFPYHKALGYYYVITNQFDQAMYHLKMVDDEKDGELHNYLSLLYHKLENIPYSIEHTLQATTIFQKKMDHPSLLFTHIVKAMNDLHLGKYKLAKENLEHLLRQRQSLNKELLLCLLGLIGSRQENYNEALTYMKEANYNEKDTFMKVMYVYFVAHIHMLEQNKKQALSYIEAGLTLKENTAYQYKLWIQREIILGNTRSASFQKRLKDEIIPFFKQAGDTVELNICLHLMGEIHALNHNYKKSSYYFSQTTGNQQIAELLRNYPQK